MVMDNLTELLDMLNAVTTEEGCTVFEHSPEEIGICVMEHHEAIRNAIERGDHLNDTLPITGGVNG